MERWNGKPCSLETQTQMQVLHRSENCYENPFGTGLVRFGTSWYEVGTGLVRFWYEVVRLGTELVRGWYGVGTKSFSSRTAEHSFFVLSPEFCAVIAET